MILDKIKSIFKGEKKIKELADIKVALISDQFTYDSYKYEFKVITINPNDWKEKFEKEKPDIFFCESAWDGHNFDGLYGPWREKVYRKLEGKENRTVLLEILDYCKRKSIPTVFWNKEDPPHYRDHRLSYADTASLFDYIFTTSANCVEHYRKDFNHPHVYTLMFAGQPKLFNPLNTSGETIDDVVFAGSYYEDKPERARLMEEIFDRLIAKGIKLRIYDRQHFKNWGNYPERYQEYTLPPIDYSETAEVYRKMKWGLNFNIVTDSETMFARRVFELALSNVYIITNYSVGVSNIFEDNIFVFDRQEGIPDFTKDYEIEKLNNLYNVLENHTYKNRWKQVLDTIGFEYVDRAEEITVIFRLTEENGVEDILSKFNSIDYPQKTLRILADENYADLSERHEEVFTDIDELKDGISGDFWILTDGNIESDFIRKAILHYQYLDRSISVCRGYEKFTLGREKSPENKVINVENIAYIDDDTTEFEVYYI